MRFEALRSETVRSDRRRLLTAALAAGGLTLAPAARAAQAAGRAVITDDVGRRVALTLPLRRAVVFNRYTTEFIRAIGAMPAVAGVDFDPLRHPGYWPEVTAAMFAGSGQSAPNYEAIAALRPDAVFLPRNSDWKKAAQLLAGFGIPVVVLTGWDLLKHEWTVDLLGRLFARPREAARLNVFYRTWRDLLAARLQGVTRKKLYFEEVGDYKTCLPGSGWHDMIEAGGALNLFGDVKLAGANVQNFEVDPEQVLARRPDVIVKLQPGQYEPHGREFSQQALERIARRPGFDGLPAVRSGQVFHLSYYLASGCSKITGAVQIAKWLYPERMAGVEPEAVMGSWLRDFQGVPAKTGYWLSLADLRR